MNQAASTPLVADPSERDALRRKLALCVERGDRPRHRRWSAFGPAIGSRALRRGLVPGKTTLEFSAHTFWGDRMRVVLPEALSQQLLAARYFEEGLTAYLLGHLSSGATFFDVGAHFGYFSLLASRLVGPSGRVHAFEPTPSTLRVLTQNMASQTNVTIMNAAVWNEAAELTFNDFGPAASMFNSLRKARLGDDADGSSARDIQVAAIALDDYVEMTGAVPDFVKIDAESAEREVLGGTDRTLRAHRPIVTVEVGDFDVPGAADSRELVDHVIGLGYEPFEYAGKKIVRHQPRARYDYDNLLFMPTGGPR